MTLQRFKDKSVLISGGAGGLGSVIAATFITQGAKVGILDSNIDAINLILGQL